MSDTHRLTERPIHLGLGASAEPQPPMEGGMEWYEAYSRRTAADGAEGRLVSQHHFDEDWPSWEMHPVGSEVVICIEGAMILHQENPDGMRTSTPMQAGDYAINPPGVWHIADVENSATAIFITAGEGTQHRPR